MKFERQALGTWARWSGIAFGAATQVLFAITVWQLFWFLKDGVPPRKEASLWLDAALSLQFGVAHSWLLLPSTKNRITKFLSKELYGCLFCLATCVGMLVMFAGWHGSSIVIWEFDGGLRTALLAGFYASWGLLVYSLSLTGLGYQTGFTPWWHWVRGEPQPRRIFEPRGIYLWMRHPVYLSVLGLIWLTPRMTLDHAVLTLIWTTYTFFGSYLKDERLAYFYGETYRNYQMRVTGYPLLGMGPLGFRRPEKMSTEALSAAADHAPPMRNAA